MTRISAARLEEAGALAALAAQCLVDPWSEGAFAEELRIPVARVLAAREAERLVGYVALRRHPDAIEILSLAVAPERRRRGLGRSLLETAWSVGAGPGRMMLEVRTGNTDARAFYARLGFQVVGRRPRYYPDGDDALLLCLEHAPQG